ncbi:unnamed protein product [Caenorhabditis auriculariae]|uniref:Uncharacterized protein n=1 Tax=Caenorhabditis auriculariae TaxID=2777116 RepID=A0A8S1HMS6_9PELO|nr:unnamed protein product [Caenorhabditis auriculariae]
MKRDLIGLYLLLTLVEATLSRRSCSSSLLETSCPQCCAMLFSSTMCRLDEVNDVLKIRENGSGVLGAIWDDAPKAVIVRNGCLLETWDWKNQTGPKRAFGLDGYKVFKLERHAFESRISSVRCTCRNPPPTSTKTPSSVDETLWVLEEEDSIADENDDANSTYIEI